MTHIPGEYFALLAAFTWAFALVLFKYSGESISPLALNLFKCTVGVVLLALTLPLTPYLQFIFGDESFAALLAQPPKHIWIMVASGVIGIALADTIFFYSLNIVGVGIVSIVDCLYTPFVFLFSALLLGEDLSWPHYLGAALILMGVLISSGHAPPRKRTRAQLLLGLAVGVLAMAAMAFGIVIAKPALETFPLIWAALIRLLAGTVVLAIAALLLSGRAKYFRVFRPAKDWKTAIPGAFLGTYLAYLFWVAGFKFANASINAILNQTNVIIAIVLATVIVKERMTRRKACAVVFAFVGVLIVLANKRLVQWLA